MENKLREYLDQLFEDTPKTGKALELKEEMTQNLIDKYRDLLAEGKTEEAAFNIAIAGIGDVSGLLREMEAGDQMAMQREKRRMISAALTAAAIMLYILSIIPVLLMEKYGVVAMFVLIALATGLIIFNSMTKPKYHRADETVVEDFKEWQSERAGKNEMRKALSSALWSITVVIYLLISFATHAWYITWVIFLIAGAVESLIKAIVSWKK